MKPTYQAIKTIEELKEYTKVCFKDLFISLGGGGIRSSKEIYYNEPNDTFEIFHGIDGSVGTYTIEQLAEETNIITAMEKNALFAEIY